MNKYIYTTMLFAGGPAVVRISEDSYRRFVAFNKRRAHPSRGFRKHIRRRKQAAKQGATT